jgi:hypothetical protein
LVALFTATVLAWSALRAEAQGPDPKTAGDLPVAQQPTPSVRFANEITNTIYSVAVRGRYAYVGMDNRLAVIDISDVEWPVIVGQSGALPGDPDHITVDGDYAYVANGYTGLRVINISNPMNPVEVGAYFGPAPYPCIDMAVDVAVAGDRAYTVNFDYGLRVFDVSDRTNPRLNGVYLPQQRSLGVAAVGKTAYMAGGDGGLRIVDASNPAAPVEIGSHPGLVGWSNDVAVQGNRAYLADGLFGWGGFSIIDISTPAAPRMLGYVDVGDTTRVTVAGNYAYVIAQYGMYIFDISKLPITAVGYYDTRLQAPQDLAVSGNYIYLAAGDYYGLIILRLVEDQVAVSIPTGGGGLSSTSGDTHLIFPSGAFTDTVLLNYYRLWHDQDTGDLVGIDHTFEVPAFDYYSDPRRPAQLVAGQSYTLTVQYTDAEKGPAIENTLALYYWGDGRWNKEPTSVVDTASNTVTATPNHWTHLWAVLGETRRAFLPVVYKR